ncbi:MAG TPA: methyltransferase [Chloroflexia bacterium]
MKLQRLLGGKRSPVRRLVRRAAKSWLAWRYRDFSPDVHTSRYVKVAGLRLLVGPTTFNPALHYTSAFFAEHLAQPGVIARRARVLDIGTGSGVLAISAALAGAGQVTAVDLNPAAVLTARLNASLYGLAGRVKVVHGDMFEPVAGQLFDLVVCNPPYLRGEPSSPGMLAYMAGEDFQWLRRFSQSWGDYLTPSGQCLLVLADSTDLKSVFQIFRGDGWVVQQLATRDVTVERLFIIALYRVP